MPGTFGYTESTNLVVITGGTAGSPADFASFVTADRAGTDTKLLDAGAPASDLALTYAVRPVEDLALLVKCVVANKTAEADFIFITGTNFKGNAQTESVDVTAGNGSYETTKSWASITTLDCSDNAAGGGTVWADGDLTVTQDIWGVIWDYGNGQYLVDANFAVGDASTSTYMVAKSNVHAMGNNWDANAPSIVINGDFDVTLNATFNLGVKVSNDMGAQGGTLEARKDGTCTVNGFLGIYDSTFIYAYFSWNSYAEIWGSFEAIGSNIVTRLSTTYTCNLIRLRHVVWSTYTGECTQDIVGSTEDCLDIRMDNANKGVWAGSRAAIISEFVGSNLTKDVYVSEGWGETMTVDCINSTVDLTNVTIIDAAGEVREKYTCNIHVADKGGDNLQSVTVLCEDKNDTQSFSVSTDANGDIAEQIILYKDAVGTSETLTTYSPHKFTFSKAGYETLVLENITVDGPINWHLEMQGATGPGVQKQWR